MFIAGFDWLTVCGVDFCPCLSRHGAVVSVYPLFPPQGLVAVMIVSRGLGFREAIVPSDGLGEDDASLPLCLY